MLRWRIGVAVALAALVGACAQLPSAAKVKQFADSVGKVAAVYSLSIDFNRDISERTADEFAATLFIARYGGDNPDCILIANQIKKILKNGSAQKLSGPCDYKLPPESTRQISDENKKLRLGLINAINRYAKALGEAADQGAIDNVEAAVLALGAATSTAVTPLLGGAAVPVISPAAKIISRGAGLAVGNAYAVEIREIVAQAHEPLRKAAGLLKASIRVVKINNETKLQTWRVQKKNNLGIIAKKPENDDLVRSSSSEAYGDFRAAVAEARALHTKVAALDGFEKVLDSMVEAHAELLNPNLDVDDAISNFTTLTDDFAALIPALRKN